MKKVVLTMALVAMMSVSCKDQAATEETAVEATEAVDTAAAAVDTAAAAVDSAATEVKEEVKK